MIKLMWKVVIMNKDGKGAISLFERRKDAEVFAEMIHKNGESCYINRWTWRTEIEE